jgi:serine/threonine protein kinase
MAEIQSTLSPGEIVGHYHILGIAGAGGMGVVYKAFDQRLERTVALKFLPASMISSAKEKERFLKEARAASSLDHPNIGVIYGVEELSVGRSYIVMAFYEGKSLAHEIREGPISCEKAIDIALQMTRGLDHAHRHKIVHRDKGCLRSRPSKGSTEPDLS